MEKEQAGLPLATPPVFVLALYVVATLVAVLVSYYGLAIPLVSVCVFVVLEALLVACLGKVPVWTWVLFVVLQLAGGWYFDKLYFMCAMVVVFLCAELVRYAWTRNYGR